MSFRNKAIVDGSVCGYHFGYINKDAETQLCLRYDCTKSWKGHSNDSCITVVCLYMCASVCVSVCECVRVCLTLSVCLSVSKQNSS